MFGISKKQYICGLRTGHKFIYCAMCIKDNGFEAFPIYTFACDDCGFTYKVKAYELTKEEAAIIKRSNPNAK